MDKIIVLDGIDYLICNEINLDGNHYIYAVSTEGNKFTVLKETMEVDGSYVESLTDENEIKRVLQEIEKENN